MRILPSDIIISPVCTAHGSSADIYEGKMSLPNCPVELVAIKMFRYQRNNKNDEAQKVLREYATWCRLAHPNILPCYGFWTGPDLTSVALVSPLCANGNIMAYIRDHQNISSLRLVADIAAGLTYLHKNQVVHGDVKLSNILVNDHGRACLIDFGLAKNMDMPALATENVQGTWRYMANEMLDPGPTAHGSSYATDVWAFGMTALEVLSALTPFNSEVPDSAVILAVVQGKRPARERFPMISDLIWARLASCWMPNPNQRPSMRALRGFFDLEADPRNHSIQHV